MAPKQPFIPVVAGTLAVAIVFTALPNPAEATLHPFHLAESHFSIPSSTSSGTFASSSLSGANVVRFQPQAVTSAAGQIAWLSPDAAGSLVIHFTPKITAASAEPYFGRLFDKSLFPPLSTPRS
jgi:hypothetical protein